MSAQVSFTPSTLTWSADDTSAKTVTVHSPGWWDTDSTSHSSHFNLSRYNGWNGYEIEISPLSTNNSGGTITEDIPFTTPGSSGTSYLRLIHQTSSASLYVNPSSLSWGASETGQKSVQVTCPGSWTASVSGSYFSVSPSSGSGNATVYVHPISANGTAIDRLSSLTISGASTSKRVSLLQSGVSGEPGTLSVSPSTLTWNHDETDTKYVRVQSVGRWESDSTGIGGHFSRGEFNGYDNTLVGITPVSKNDLDGPITKEVEIWDMHNNRVALTLIHRSLLEELSVTPSALSWAATDTGPRTVNIECDGAWSARMVGVGFSVSLASGSGDAAVAVMPCGRNGSNSTLEALLEVSSPGKVTRSVLLSQTGDGSALPSLGTDSIPCGDPGMAIPFERSVTPTGAVSYAVPVMTDPTSKYAPSLTLTYNSQSGNGIAGFGWSLSGLPSIAQIPKNRHNHGESAPALISSSDRAYALDGNALVSSEAYMSGKTDCPYETIRGHVRVKQVEDGFEAWYPDGSRAHFGTCAPGEDVFYPVTEMEDRFGRRIEVTYMHDGGLYYPLSVTYNVTGGHQAVITFSYSGRTDNTCAYYAGVPLSQNKLLREIVSGVSSEELRTYTLEHTFRGGVNVLSGIECTRGESCIAPLRFEYGGDLPAPTGSMDMEDPVFINCGPQIGDAGTTLYRGKFSVVSYEDGTVSLPKYPNYVRNEYEADDDGGYHFAQCSSGFPSDARIYLAPNVSVGDTVSFTVGENFQDLQVLDVNNDGLDEIVKVNYNIAPFNQNRTGIRIVVLGYNESTGSLYEKSSHLTDITGSVIESYKGITHYSLRQRMYRYGCFKQDGTVQLLAVSYSRDMLGRTMPANAALIDINTGDLMYDGIFSGIPFGEDARLFVADLDSDGISEICVAGASGLGIYKYSNGIISLVRTCSGITVSDLKKGNYSLTDLNADGMLDIVCRHEANSVWDAFYYTGTYFEKKSWPVGLVGESDSVVFIDIDRDGLPDAVNVNQSTGEVKYSLNRNGILAEGLRNSGVMVQPGSDLLPVNLIGHNAARTLSVVKNGALTALSFSRDVQKMRLLTGMKDSRLNLVRHAYGDVSEGGPAYDNTSSLVMGEWYAERSFPLPVVSGTTVTSGGVCVESRTYSYCDAVVSTDGLGFLCFGCVREKDNILDISTESINDPAVLGHPVIVTAHRGNITGPRLSRIENFVDPVYNSFGKPVDTRLMMVSSIDDVSGIRGSDSNMYDAYGFPVSSTSERWIDASHKQTRTATRTYDHSDSTGVYVLGTLREEIMLTDLDGVPGNNMGTSVMIMTDEFKRPESVSKEVLSTRKVLFGNNYRYMLTHSPLSEVHYSYDAFGNVSTETRSEYGADSTSVSSFNYDADGRFLVSSEDALGRVTTYGNRTVYGNPLTVSDWLGRSTSYTYDTWGNCTQTLYPDGTQESSSTSWSASEEPGQMVVESSGSGKPQTKTWYDALGREVRNANQRFDGSWQYADTQYYNTGKVRRTSLPYKDLSNGPVLWNTYTYDNLGRPLALTDANGRVRTWEYSLTETSETDEGLSITRTSVTDASGNIISTTDPSGTVRYALRDDGKPVSVTVEYVMDVDVVDTVRTTFSYDVYGRRTEIVDPSAGTRTDTYTDNADGTSSIAHTGPNGTVTTNHDRFGRVTSVTRPEFSTSYTYGTALNSSSYGKLLSETSTNGTKKEYSYDVYGRMVTCKEWENAGRWLEATYSYNTDGTLSSVAFTSDRGYITTENYTYAYGTNTGINIPGTTVFRLTEENEMGLPTRVTTGGVGRLYGYTSTGLATSRRLTSSGGAVIQDFGYTFDSLTGNLTQRTDGRWGSSYEFHYGGMDQLLDGMEYSANGNILQKGGYSLEYSSMSDPYKMTGAHRPGEFSDLPHHPNLSIGMTSFDRPSTITEGSNVTVFRYGADGNRVSMSAPDTLSGRKMERVYLGGTYERDITGLDASGGTTTDTKTVERLFLGGSAYDAPMVLVKAAGVNGGAWTPFNIGRNWQGSITHVAMADGTLVEEFAYSPWGEESTPDALDTLSVVDVVDFGDMEPVDGSLILPEYPGEGETELNLPEPLNSRLGLSLYVGAHGYTGHEHLWQYGLINCNARIYDPSVGRFLSPDPLVQDPASTQNFNRYSYCLNNPLKYTDPSGEIVWELALIAGHIAGMVNMYMHKDAIESSHSDWTFMKYYGIGFLSGFIGSATAGASAVPGFLGGGFSAATNSFLPAFILGYGNAALSGSTDPLVAGICEGFASAATGFIIGGLTGGIDAMKHGGNFLTGEGTMSDYFADKHILINDNPIVREEAYDYAAQEYPKYTTWVRNLNLDDLPTGYKYDSYGRVLNRDNKVVLGASKYNGIFKKTSDVYIFPGSYSDFDKLSLVMGHEFGHAMFDYYGLYAYNAQHGAIFAWEYNKAKALNYHAMDESIDRSFMKYAHYYIPKYHEYMNYYFPIK